MQLSIDAAARACPICGGSMLHRATQARYCSRRCLERGRNKERYDDRTRYRYPQLQDPNWLRHHYIGLEESEREIASLLGCSKCAVAAARYKFGISRKRDRRNTLKKRRGLDEAGIVRAYQTNLMPTPEIAKEWKIGIWTVYAVLRDHGVIRNKQEAGRIGGQRARARKSHANRAELRRRHTGKRRSLKKFNGQRTACFLCDREVAIELHHLNGIRSDDRAENLVPLCAKCHTSSEWLISHALKGLRQSAGSAAS